MQKIVFVFLSFLFLGAACEDKPVPPGEDAYQHSPSSPLPAGFEGGTWFWGNSGPLSYYDHDGNNVGSATEAGRQYKFTEINGQGRLEFEQYLGLRNASNCVTEIYTRKQGTVKFEGGNKFTFFPVEGSFKTVKSGTAASCSKETTERKATGEDLSPVVYLYQLLPVDGQTLLYVYAETDVQYTNPLFVYQQAE
jgi:hypothetical protein